MFCISTSFKMLSLCDKLVCLFLSGLLIDLKDWIIPLELIDCCTVYRLPLIDCCLITRLIPTWFCFCAWLISCLWFIYS